MSRIADAMSMAPMIALLASLSRIAECLKTTGRMPTNLIDELGTITEASGALNDEIGAMFKLLGEYLERKNKAMKHLELVLHQLSIARDDYARSIERFVADHERSSEPTVVSLEERGSMIEAQTDALKMQLRAMQNLAKSMEILQGQ